MRMSTELGRLEQDHLIGTGQRRPSSARCTPMRMVLERASSTATMRFAPTRARSASSVV